MHLPGITRKLAGAKLVSQSDAEARSITGDVGLKGFDPKVREASPFEFYVTHGAYIVHAHVLGWEGKCVRDVLLILLPLY